MDFDNFTLLLPRSIFLNSYLFPGNYFSRIPLPPFFLHQLTDILQLPGGVRTPNYANVVLVKWHLIIIFAFAIVKVRSW